MNDDYQFFKFSKKLIGNPDTKHAEIKTVYYEQVNKGVPLQILNRIRNNTLVLTGCSLPDGQTNALAKAIVEQQTNPEYIIKRVIIDECQITPANLLKIMQALSAVKISQLSKVSLAGVQIDEHCSQELCKLIFDSSSDVD